MYRGSQQYTKGLRQGIFTHLVQFVYAQRLRLSGRTICFHQYQLLVYGLVQCSPTTVLGCISHTVLTVLGRISLTVSIVHGSISRIVLIVYGHISRLLCQHLVVSMTFNFSLISSSHFTPYTVHTTTSYVYLHYTYSYWLIVLYFPSFLSEDFMFLILGIPIWGNSNKYFISSNPHTILWFMDLMFYS